jgi:hypothetical protein
VKLLDQFIAQTAKKPAEWTSQDIQQYLNYVEKRVNAGSAQKTALTMRTRPHTSRDIDEPNHPK